MDAYDFIDKLHESFKSMERTEMVVHHRSRLHSFGRYVLESLANKDCKGSEEALEAINKKRTHP